MKRSLFLLLSLIASAFANTTSISQQSVEIQTQPIVAVAPNCIPNHSGFYIGAGIGASSLNLKVENEKAYEDENKVNKTKTCFVGGFKAGYGWQFHDFYFAPEIEFLMHSFHIKKHYTQKEDRAFATPIPATVTIITRDSIKSKCKWSGNLGLKAGYVFKNSIAYLKTGISICQMSTSLYYHVNMGGLEAAVRANKKSKHTGWIIGVGYDYYFTKNIGMFMDISYTLYNKKDVSFLASNSSTVQSSNMSGQRTLNVRIEKDLAVKFQVATALIGIRYKI